MEPLLETAPPGARNSSGGWTLLCLLLLIFAAAEFTARGPVRALHTATQFNDFLSPYIQAKAFLRGLDPYSPQILVKLWPPEAPQYTYLSKEVAHGTLVANRGFPTAYPITAFVLIGPFSLLPWNLAYALWLGLTLILFCVMLYALVALSGFSYRDPSAILLIAACVALAPFHSGIVTANASLVAVEASVIAIWSARNRHEVTAAVLLAIATGLKPQIGLCFLLYYLLRRRWQICRIALGLLASATAIGLLRLEFSHTPWLSNYMVDNHTLLESGVLGNFSAINPTRFGLINLQVALYPLLNNTSLTNIAAWLVGLILFGTWLVLIAQRRHDEDRELLGLSAIAVISLLPVYHRFYDATLLALPLCCAILSFRKFRSFATLSLLLILPFLIPGGSLLETAVYDGRIPAALTHRWWWDAFVMAHQVWLLLFLAVLLLYQNRVSQTENSGRTPRASPPYFR